MPTTTGTVVHPPHNTLHYAAPDADATADFYSALQDPSRWIVKPGVPIFKPHRRTDPNTGKEIHVDVHKLHEIAQNMQRLEQDGGVPVRITLGHTQPSAPETRQPPVAGYYRNARVGVFGPKREPAVIADEWLDPQYGPVRKNFPYRSSEYYDDDKQITGVALLSRDPYLDLGVVAYSRSTPGPVHYSRAGTPAPYQFVFGETDMAQPTGYSPQYGATPQPQGRPTYPQHAPPAGQTYTATPAPAGPAPVMYAAPQPAPYAGDGSQTQYSTTRAGTYDSWASQGDPALYTRPTPYRGPWPGPAYKPHSIGHNHPQSFRYGSGRRPAPYRNAPQPPRPQRPSRYDDMGGMGMYDDPMGMPPGGGMGQPPMGPEMGGMPPGMPGQGSDMGGMPPGGDPSGAPGGLPEVVGLLEQVLQVLEGQVGMEPNDAPPDSPFPDGDGPGGMQDGPEEADEGEGGVETEDEGGEKEDYAYRGRQTAYAPPSRTGWTGGPNNGMEEVSTGNPPRFRPAGAPPMGAAWSDTAGNSGAGFPPASHRGGGTGSVSGANAFGVARGGVSALGRPRGQVVGAPRGTQVQNSMYSNQPPRAGRPAASGFRPGARRYSREDPMPTPRQPAPRGGQAPGRQAAPTQYAQPPGGDRIRTDRLTYEVDQLKRQNQLLMYERDQADTAACEAEISRLASLGYPVDQWEVGQLKQTPKEHRQAYIATIAARYSRVPTDGIAPMPGDPSPSHEPAPQGPVRLTREGMDAAMKYSEQTGVPLQQAIQYMKGEAPPVMYGPPAQAPGYGPPPFPQQLEYPAFGGGSFADPYPGA